MSKNHITIAKPDKSRSCHTCRKSEPPEILGNVVVRCKHLAWHVSPDTAQTCEHFRDSRQTSQVISASGKVGPA